MGRGRRGKHRSYESHPARLIEYRIMPAANSAQED
jgi:hypothetical protein